MTSNAKLRTIITLESESGPFISIFIALNKNNDANKLLNIVKQTFVDKYSEKEWQPYQKQLNKRMIKRAMNFSRSQSLVIYIGPNIFHIFKLRYYPVQTKFVIGNTMQVIPVIAEYQFKSLNHIAVLKRKAIDNIKFHYKQSSKIHKTSNNIKEIIHAATAGKIDALIVNKDIYNQGHDKISEIMNDLAITTAGFDGNVFVLNEDQMPVANSKLAMIERM